MCPSLLLRVRQQSSSTVKRRFGKDSLICSRWPSLWPRLIWCQDPLNIWRRLVLLPGLLGSYLISDIIIIGCKTMLMLSMLCRICQTPFMLVDAYLQTQCGTMSGNWKRHSPRFVWGKVYLYKSSGLTSLFKGLASLTCWFWLFLCLQELCLIRFHPATEEEEVAYVSLFSYFSSRKRFGVVANNNRRIKDLYLIPLGSKDPLPSKLLPFDGPGKHLKRYTNSLVVTWMLLYLSEYFCS